MIVKNIRSFITRAFWLLLKITGAIIVVFLGLSLIPFKSTVKLIQPRSDTQYWMLADGNRIAFTMLEGDSSNQNPPVVFLHGGPGGYVQSSMIELMNALSNSGYDIYLMIK